MDFWSTLAFPMTKASIGALSLAVVLSALGIGCKSCRLPIVDHPRSFSGVRMQDVTFWSSSLGRNMPYRVYLPASLPRSAKIAAVYLLHGGGGGFRDWSNDSSVGQYAARGYLLVMPEGDSSYYMNEALAPAERYRDYLTNDLVADVERRFPAAPDRAHRAILGVSMGGFAAVNLALTRPDLFAFAGGISPAVDVPSRRFTWRRWGQSMRFRRIFGPDGSASRRAEDPFLLVKAADPAITPYLYITAGNREPLLDSIERFGRLLARRGFASEFHTSPGGHDWNEWNAQIPGCFAALIQRMPSHSAQE